MSPPTVTPLELPTAKDPLPSEPPVLAPAEDSKPSSTLLLALGLLELACPPKVVTEMTLGAVAMACILVGMLTVDCLC